MRIEKIPTSYRYEVYCGKGHKMRGPYKSSEKYYICPKCSETCSIELFKHYKDGGMK